MLWSLTCGGSCPNSTSTDVGEKSLGRERRNGVLLGSQLGWSFHFNNVVSPRAVIQGYGLQRANTCSFFLFWATSAKGRLSSCLKDGNLCEDAHSNLANQCLPCRARWLVQGVPIRILPWLWLHLCYPVPVKWNTWLSLGFLSRSKGTEATRWQLRQRMEGANLKYGKL